MEQQGQEQKDLYSSLDLASRQTRLFTLQPGAFTDPVEGFLTTVSLDDNPEYEALSYVWGNPNVTLPIRVDRSKFAVTTNLESALRYLRLRENPRRLWIDAICINQSDLLERNHQVKNMKLVYQSASAVLAWLGKVTASSQKGLKFLSHLMENEIGPESFGGRISQNGQCLIDIITRDYWKRIWIVQEVVVAKRVFLHCGPFSVEIPSSGCLERTTRNFEGNILIKGVSSKILDQQYLRDITSRRKRFLSVLKLREERLGARAPSLWELVWQFRHWKRHEPRDMVFALLGLVSESEVLENYPDYSLTLKQVQYRLIRSYILSHGDLSILNYCSGILSPEVPPSSLSDWAISDIDNALEELHAIRLVPFASSEGCRFREFRVSGGSNPVLARGSDQNFNSLTLRGFLIDSINYLGSQYQCSPLWTVSSMPDGQDTTRSLEWIRKLGGDCVYGRFRLLSQWTILREWKQHATSSKIMSFLPPVFLDLGKLGKLESFWRTIMADSICYEGMVTEPKKLGTPHQALWGCKPATDSWYGQMIDIITSDRLPRRTNTFFRKIEGPPRVDDVFQAIELAAGTRKFFVNKSGLMGLAPTATNEGDLICILLGGATPFVLRPASEDRYRFVGECYVHGIMDGEAMVDLQKGKYELQDIILV